MPPKMMTLGDMNKQGNSSSGMGGQQNEGEGNEYYTGGSGPRGGKVHGILIKEFIY